MVDRAGSGGEGTEDRRTAATELDGVAAGWRTEQAAADRGRTRWLRQQLADDTTFAAVLTALAERAEPVALGTRTGAAVRGRIAWVGPDHAAVRRDDEVVLVALRAATVVSPTSDGHVPVAGARPPGDGPTLAEVLATAAADRPRVVLVTDDGARHAGALTDVGVDVAVVHGEQGVVRYARLDSVAEVWLSAPDAWGSG